jgi:hypothetical protein
MAQAFPLDDGQRCDFPCLPPPRRPLFPYSEHGDGERQHDLCLVCRTRQSNGPTMTSRYRVECELSPQGLVLGPACFRGARFSVDRDGGEGSRQEEVGGFWSWADLCSTDALKTHRRDQLIGTKTGLGLVVVVVVVVVVGRGESRASKVRRSA